MLFRSADHTYTDTGDKYLLDNGDRFTDHGAGYPDPCTYTRVTRTLTIVIGIETTVMRTCILILIRIHNSFGGYTYPGDKHIDLGNGY